MLKEPMGSINAKWDLLMQKYTLCQALGLAVIVAGLVIIETE